MVLCDRNPSDFANDTRYILLCVYMKWKYRILESPTKSWIIWITDDDIFLISVKIAVDFFDEPISICITEYHTMFSPAITRHYLLPVVIAVAVSVTVLVIIICAIILGVLIYKRKRHGDEAGRYSKKVLICIYGHYYQHVLRYAIITELWVNDVGPFQPNIIRYLENTISTTKS